MKFILLALVALFFILAQAQSPRGLSSNATLCTNKICNWNDPAIWLDGIVPGNLDNVDWVQVSGTYTVQITTAVTVARVNIGIDDQKHEKGIQTLHIVGGGSLTITGTFDAKISANLQVDANASLVVGGQGKIANGFILAGFASFSGSNPSLNLDSVDVQLPPLVNAKMELRNTTLYVANGLGVTSSSTIIGNGVINGTVDCNGNLQPGLSGVDGGIGFIQIYGDLKFGSSADLTIDISSRSVFDTINITGTANLDGTALMNLQNNYQPLAATEFQILHHARSRSSFSTTKDADCPLNICVKNKWQPVIDQSYTAVLYDDATTVLISFTAVVACLLLTLL